MKYSMLLPVMLFLTISSFSQNFTEILKDGDKLMKEGDYYGAYRKYDAAEATDPNRKNEAKLKRDDLFIKIEWLGIEAVKAKSEAQAQKEIADLALAQANKFINALDLSEKKLALAYKDGKVGYIDKKGDLVIPYRYEIAGAFDNTGFAKVQTIEECAIPNSLGVKTEYRPVDYLIDPQGRQYKVAYRFEDIKTEEEITDTVKIKALDLRNTGLNSFPPQILDQPQLEIIILNARLRTENNLKAIPIEIGNFQNLKYFSASGCNIGTIPTEIGQLSGLQTLDLENNDLKSLPPEFIQLKELQVLNLSDNQLEKLPEGIGQLKKLQVLLITDNPIKTLPADFAELKSLRILDLRKSSLGRWPAGLEKIKTLEQLNFGSNSLTAFPNEILQLTKLEFLDLSFNPKTTVPFNIKKFTELKFLSLRRNELNDLMPGLELPDKLRVLDLSGNNFTNFPKQILKLTNLESLDLSFNEDLTSIPREIGQLKKLKTLTLNDTAIKEPEQKKIKSYLPGCNIIFKQKLSY